MKRPRRRSARATLALADAMAPRIRDAVLAMGEIERARVRREEREFQRAAGARAVLHRLLESGVLRPDIAAAVREYFADRSGGYRVLMLDGHSLIPPTVDE